MKIRRAASVLVLGLVPGLSGCLWHTHAVQMTKPPAVVYEANLDQLLKQTQTRYDAVKTMTASATIAVSTGGSKKGSVTDYGPFSSHILMRKPEDLRVLISVLSVRTVDMITDGKTFTLEIPPKSAAIEDSNEVPARASANTLYNLRPQMFFDSMFIRGLQPGEQVSRTMDERVYQPDPNRKDLIDEPDYDIMILRPKSGSSSEMQTLRVIHFGRATLLPYQQDIYGDSGQLVTKAQYEKYQKFGGVDYPTKITISHPVDQLTIIVTIDPAKLILNQPMENDQFELIVPPNYKICKPSAGPCTL